MGDEIMSELLSKLARAEGFTMNEINDLDYMYDKLYIWLDNGLITDDEYNKLFDELNLSHP
jgi:hypothetical protein